LTNKEDSIWRVAGVPRREVATSERHGRRPATILLFGCAQSARRRWARSASLTQRWAHARRDVFRELTAEEEAEIKASGTPNDRVGLRPSASAAATAASRCGDETPKAAKPPSGVLGTLVCRLQLRCDRPFFDGLHLVEPGLVQVDAGTL
jgi:hypothetical protein